MARRQLRNRVSGSSTTTASSVESCSRKNTSHRLNSPSEPAIIILMMRPECVAPWNESGRLSACEKKRFIASSRLRCASRSACSAVTMLDPMPPSPTAAHSPSSAVARPQSASGGTRSDCESRSMTRPNSTGSRNCSPASAMAAAVRPKATHLSGFSSPSTRM